MRKKKSSVPPLPPLSLKSLDHVQKIERYASNGLAGCSNRVGVLVNPEKALRILRACIVEVFDAQHDYYRSLSVYRHEWVLEIAQTTINTAIGLMPMFTDGEPFREELNRTLEAHFAEKARASEAPKTTTQDRKKMRDLYLAKFPHGIQVLDICWAAGQRYSEWKRWLRYAVKDGSTPDRAFRALLTSGKNPAEYRKQQRPKGWK